MKQQKLFDENFQGIEEVPWYQQTEVPSPIPKNLDSAVVLFSGGLDSTVLLYYVLQVVPQNRVLALSVNYNQKHKKELESARSICNMLAIKHQIFEMPDARSLLGGSALTDGNVSLPLGHYAEETMKATVVPNRNMIMLSLATAAAISNGYGAVCFAAHAGDHFIYPDCRPEFITTMQKTVMAANAGFIREDFKILVPFISSGKHNIAGLGLSLGVPFTHTWSCYDGGAYHCGQCGTCNERKEAFELAGIKDLTPYAFTGNRDEQED